MDKVVELMLAIKENCVVFYHKDTRSFDYLPFSEEEMKTLSPNRRLLMAEERNSIPLPAYREINHREIMSFYVKEFIEDKELRKKLFYVLRRKEYMDAYMNMIREAGLSEDFSEKCMDYYKQIFDEWTEKNGLDFR